MVKTEAEAAQAYTQIRIGTAPKRQAVYLLHEKCIHLMQKALYFSDTRRIFLNRAQNILSQLELSLIVDDDVSKSLYFIYDYCYTKLETGDPTDVVDALKLMRPLRNTFYLLLTNP